MNALNSLFPYEEAIARMDENLSMYEDWCEKIQFKLSEIDNALFGHNTENYLDISNVEIRLMIYWDYLKGEIDENELFQELRRYAKSLELYFE
jgi:hypothetical protein